MEHVFKPSLCDGVKYEGSVTLHPIGYDERLDLFEVVAEADEKKQSIVALKAAAKKSISLVKAVAIKRMSDGKEWTSWDHVYHDFELSSVVTEVCKKIMGEGNFQ